MNTKIFLIALGVFVSSVISAQNKVGINTTTPNATLEVKGKATDATIPDGVIAPQLTKAQLDAKATKYLAAQTGAIVYVTDASTASADSRTAAVNAIGYYYFDGSKWVQFAPVTPATYISIIRPWNGTGQQSLISSNTAYSYGTAGIVDFSYGNTPSKQNFAAPASNKITIPATGIYEVNFVAGIGDGGTSATSFKAFIGNGSASLADAEVTLGTGAAGPVSCTYIGSFNSGDNLDFRVASSGTGTGDNCTMRSFMITVKKL